MSGKLPEKEYRYLDNRLLNRLLKGRYRNKDFFLALFLLVFCMALFFWLIPFHIGGYGGTRLSARFFPICITIALTFLGFLLLYRSIRNSEDEATRPEDKRINRFTIFCMLVLFAYYSGVVVIGMVPASILALFVMVRLYGLRHWLLATLLSTVFVILLFFFFDKLAHVDVPRGVLFEGWY